MNLIGNKRMYDWYQFDVEIPGEEVRLKVIFFYTRSFFYTCYRCTSQDYMLKLANVASIRNAKPSY